MPRLVVLGFESKEHADAASAITEQLEHDGALHLLGMALGWRDERGNVRIEHAVSLTQAGATTGVLTGGLIGLVLLMPLLGAAIGATGGAAGGKLSELGLDRLIVKDIVETLEPGRAALFVLAESADADRVTEALRPHRPTVIKTTLPEWEEHDLIRALTGPHGNEPGSA
jgi:uncharacterized membrane protein